MNELPRKPDELALLRRFYEAWRKHNNELYYDQRHEQHCKDELPRFPCTCGRAELDRLAGEIEKVK